MCDVVEQTDKLVLFGVKRDYADTFIRRADMLDVVAGQVSVY